MKKTGSLALFLVFSLFYFSVAEVTVETEEKETEITAEDPQEILTSTGRESRQRKWFQPSSFILSDIKSPIKKSGLPAGNDGRLFKLMHKGSSKSPIEVFADVVKKAIEELNDQFERFGETFAIFVQNEIEVAALTPDPETLLSVSLSQALTSAVNSNRQITVSLIGALSRFLGIDLQPLINSLLGDTTLGGLPVVGSGASEGLLGGLLGPQGLLTGPVLGK